MSAGGFTTRVPEAWSRLWLLMWGVTSISLLALSFLLAFWPDWVIATLPLFFLPEGISLLRKDDRLPPLTHTIRHFVPNAVAFPLIYFFFGAISARALGFDYPRNLHVGGLFAILGWLTDHFAVTYAQDDPHPFSGVREARPETTDPRGMAL